MRKPNPRGEKIGRTVRLYPDQWEKVDSNGGAEALRNVIDLWKPKKKG